MRPNMSVTCDNGRLRVSHACYPPPPSLLPRFQRQRAAFPVHIEEILQKLSQAEQDVICVYFLGKDYDGTGGDVERRDVPEEGA